VFTLTLVGEKLRRVDRVKSFLRRKTAHRFPGSDLNNFPKISAAQGQKLSILGVCHLILQIGYQNTSEPVELLVVDDLFVPLLLGTPWIDTHVVQIEPRTR
jgi:hypothetical protein